MKWLMLSAVGSAVEGAGEDSEAWAAAVRSKLESSGSSSEGPRGFWRTSVILCLGAWPRSQAIDSVGGSDMVFVAMAVASG